MSRGRARELEHIQAVLLLGVLWKMGGWRPSSSASSPGGGPWKERRSWAGSPRRPRYRRRPAERPAAARLKLVQGASVPSQPCPIIIINIIVIKARERVDVVAVEGVGAEGGGVGVGEAALPLGGDAGEVVGVPEHGAQRRPVLREHVVVLQPPASPTFPLAQGEPC